MLRREERQSVQERMWVVCVGGFGRQDVADTLACCTCYEDALFEECAIAMRAGRGCHIVPQKDSSVRVGGWGQSQVVQCGVAQESRHAIAFRVCWVLWACRALDRWLIPRAACVFNLISEASGCCRGAPPWFTDS